MTMPFARSVERQATRMHQMMERLEVDPTALVRLRNGEAYTEARSRCLTCLDSSDCLRWLDGYGSADECPEFCPNLKIFNPRKKGQRSC